MPTKLTYQIHIPIKDYSQAEPILVGFPEVTGRRVDEQLENAFSSLELLIMREEIGSVERQGRYAVLTTTSIVEFQEARTALAKMGFEV